MAQAQTLNQAQLKRCMQQCSLRRHSLRDTTILMVSYMAGLRACEIAALNVGNVYDDAGAVREQFTLAAGQSKGARARTVWLNARLRRQLSAYGSAIDLSKPSAALFRTQKRTRFSANTMCQLFLDVYRAAGYPNASSHSGRRTFITELAAKGVGVRVLAELAGHASIQTTQRYIDVNPQQMSAAVELL